MGMAPRIQVFKAARIYTVIRARDARDTPAALDQVPAAKRPSLNPELFEAYAWYPDWTIALCCFNNRAAKLANPLVWWYVPMHPEELFFPALDCHTGDVPSLDEGVRVDHVVAVGSHRMDYGMTVEYKDKIPRQVAPYLRPEVIGKVIKGWMTNGDFVFRLDDVRRGRFELGRVTPRAA